MPTKKKVTRERRTRPKRASARKTTERRPSASRRPKPPGDDDRAVRLNAPGAGIASLALDERRALQRHAIRWSYVLRNRERWNTQASAAARQQREMRQLAIDIGLRDEDFERLAAERIVEVSIPWTGEGDDWELRIFPWEFMLSSVTRELRGGRPLTVVRHLRTGDRAAREVPATWLQVVSAPGRLAKEYDFASERALLELSVQSIGGQFHVLEDPDEDALRREITTREPHVVHLSGFDSHQGLSLVAPNRESDVLDGYLLRSSGRAPTSIDAEPLAILLNEGERRTPTLVSCNIYNSASRIAPLCVAHGAGAAIGFQDSFDDELAELFYSTLYRAWSLADWNIVSAFQFAWQTVREQNRPLQGSGIVLWSERSIVSEPKAAAAPEGARQEAIRARWHDELKETLGPDNVHDLLEVDVALISQLNYSILHNNGPIFERFRVRKKSLGVGRVDGLLVSVELHVGTDSYPFRMQASIADTAPHVDLPDAIRVSLASALGRAIRESIHTSLFVEVTWRDAVLYRQTHRVTLLPVDEWRYDADNYRWLPSFVLPRDPAVLRVVDSAQRYLMALRDDATAGFDGYQAVDVRPGRRPAPEDCALVDMQVRAIWSALLYESPLSYINPPPSFTDSSQRLRTPSDCVDGKRGTCIDLALLLASCLEYVEIYPAIILLKTHAFPAYWRHDSFHEDFRTARTGANQSEKELAEGRTSFAPGQTFAWDFGPSQYREIIGEVQAGRLVPLETTLVTGRGSFADAIVDGVQNLASRREFESMLDIVLARTDEKTRVTPLPIRRGEL